MVSTLLLLASLSFAEEPLPVEQVLPVEPTEQLKLFGRNNKVYLLTSTTPEASPLYVIATPTFNRFLADTERLFMCKDLSLSQANALYKAQMSLESCREQMTLEEQKDKELQELIASTEAKLNHRTGERNFLLGVSAAMVCGIAAFVAVEAIP